MTDAWREDVLGEGWQARTLSLRDDAQGRAVATLVRHVPDGDTTSAADDPAAPGRAVLYVHGYVDYFFQRHLGEFWTDLGYAFYALDLRAHGRSLLPHQLPNYVPDLALHAEEIDRAVAVLRTEEGHGVVVGHGHSTGGLILSLWAHARRGRPGGPAADALVLNSPWLELNRPWLDRVVSTRLVDVVGRVAPRHVVGSLAPHYGTSLHRDSGGPWEYDLAWKPHEGFGVRAGWLRSVRRGHRAVARGLAIDVPVLVCAAATTGPHDTWHDALDRTDSVLDVRHIVDRAPLLGPDVTLVQVPDGVHDLALSAEPARTAYLTHVRSWLTERTG